MGYQYSPSQNIFVHSSLKANYLNNDYPADAVDVSEDIFHTFSEIAPEGKIRIAGHDGMPAWGDMPPPTHDELVEQAEAQRQFLLTHAASVTADWRTELDLGIISDVDRDSLIAWMKYIKAVKALDTSTVPDVSWPDVPSSEN